MGPVTVAVLDSGVDSAHPALAGRLWPGINAISALPDPQSVTDDSADGHGTHVTGIITAATEGFPVRVLPVKVLGADGSGGMDDLARAVRRAVDWRSPAGERVRVINLSLGERPGSVPPDLARAVSYALEQGVLLVAAAGNERRSVAGYYPAALPGVISVAALRSDFTPDPSSNEGALVMAPAPRPGSSFAAPLVSAGAAILLSTFPELTWAELVNALLGGHEPRPCPDRLCPVFSIDRALANLGPLRAPTLGQPPPPSYSLTASVSGWAAPGAAVTVSDGFQAVAGPDGRFTIDLALPAAGEYTITAYATADGVRSRTSLPVTITVLPSGPRRRPAALSDLLPLWHLR